MEKECDICKEKIKLKKIAKIRGKYYCKKCKKKLREQRTKETIEESGIKEELKNLERKMHRDYQREYYKQKQLIKPLKLKSIEIKPIEKRKQDIEYIPKIRGQLKKKLRKQNYISFQEKQLLFKSLIKRGFAYEDADERVKKLVRSQNELTKKLRKQNKPESEIKLKSQELLEKLWNY